MYGNNYNSNSLFLNTKFGLQRVYEALAKGNINGLSATDFNNENKIPISDVPFAEFLRQNFKNLDANKNQSISSQELSQLLNSIDNKGLTFEQLQILAEQYGIYSGGSKSLLSTVMENFNKIDTNRDGRVSQAEINDYNFNKEVDDKRKEFYDFKPSDISFFSDDSSVSTDSTDTTVDSTTDLTETSTM